jgi:hypothetical protein
MPLALISQLSIWNARKLRIVLNSKTRPIEKALSLRISLKNYDY